jgi:hypothetical protein
MFFINPFIYAGGGDFESIATVTVGSGGAASALLDNIPGTYQHLQIRGISKTAGAGDGLWVRVNGDTGSNYTYHLLYGTGASAAAAAGTSQTQTVGGNQTYSGTNSSTFSGFVIDILDYASTSKNKTLRSLSGYDLNGSGEIRLSSGLWMSTSAITSITLRDSGGSNLQQYSTYALYGVKAP